jgi:protein involved in polysaccharide export with SLBB domain
MSYSKGLSIEDYINKCGGITEEAMEDEVLVIKLNGEVFKYKYKNSGFFASNDNTKLQLEPGDSILVPAKIDTKDMMVTKDISQILYQLAVSAGVLLTL